MKLYTEEQVKEIIDIAEFNKHITHEDILNEFTPIELPNDEEIEEESQNKTRVDFGYHLRITWVEGAKWLKEKILKQNIPELRNADGTYGYWGTSGGNGKSMTNQNK